MTTNLERQIKRYYESQELSPEMIERLRAMIAAGPAPSRRRAMRWYASAAALALIALSLILIARSQRWTAAEQIAREAALEHNRRLGVEVAASDYAALRARMERLDFTPVEPSAFSAMPMRLLGGRYVSLGGQPAVQLELIDMHGERCTLIEARLSDQLKPVRGTPRFQLEGLWIDVWNEKGLVMVLARPA